MAEKKQTVVKKGTVIALRRGIDVSDGTFKEILPDGSRVGVLVKTKSMRTTISNKPEEGKADANECGKSNLQEVEYATLSENARELEVSFSLRINYPFNMNTIDVDAFDSDEALFVKAFQTFLAENHTQIDRCLHIISEAYAQRIVSGAMLFRNKEKINSLKAIIEIEERDVAKKTYTYDKCHFLSKRVFNECQVIDRDRFKELSAAIYKGLTGNFVAISVRLIIDTGAFGSEVYPSQEMTAVLSGKNEVKKKLFKVDGKVAGLTSQKIANGLRRFDEFSLSGDTLAIEPLGADLRTSKAYRIGMKYDAVNFGKNSFYAYKDLITEKEGVIKNPFRDEEIIYILGVILKGGVFGNPSVKETVK